MNHGPQPMRPCFSRQAPIGIFDSGLGGTTVLRRLQALLPQENFLYFADTHNMPYGNKSPSRIRESSIKAFHHLCARVPKCIVVACYTSCSCIAGMKEIRGVPLFSMMSPLVKTVLAHHGGGRVGIWTTRATAQLNVHEKALWEGGFSGALHSIPCPLLASLIQEGDLGSPLLRERVQRNIQEMRQRDLQVLVYGCTHYPLLDHILAEIDPGLVRLDPAQALAEEVRDFLVSKDLLNTACQAGTVRWSCSGDFPLFSQQLQRLWHSAFSSEGEVISGKASAHGG